MSKTRARTALTSGDVKPVLDAGGGEHSVFAKAFLDVLRENSEVLDGFRLYREVQVRVKRATVTLPITQDPQYAPIKFAGHETGEFLFLPSSLANGNNRPGVQHVQAEMFLLALNKSLGRQQIDINGLALARRH